MPASGATTLRVHFARQGAPDDDVQRHGAGLSNNGSILGVAGFR
jgi:hypothetical protein